MRAFVPNPGVCGGRKPVELITDRAKRYRANSEGCRPKGARVCAYCGSKKNVEVGHIDGNEDHTYPSNLAWTCKSCNAGIAAVHKQLGKGKRTRQLNPKKGKRAAGRAGVPNLAEYTLAAAEHTRGRHDAGGAVIHRTPKELRRQYAAEIWRRRHERGTASTSEVPF